MNLGGFGRGKKEGGWESQGSHVGGLFSGFWVEEGVLAEGWWRVGEGLYGWKCAAKNGRE